MAKNVTSHRSRRELAVRKSSLTPINPFVDERGVIRCGGRLENAHDLSWEEKFPAVLPHSSSMVVDLVRGFHFSRLHAGVDQCLSDLRRRFWITKGRRFVRRVIGACTICQRHFKAPAVQKMAALPATRVMQGAPFRHSGVDLFGPFRVKIAGRAYHKV